MPQLVSAMTKALAALSLLLTMAGCVQDGPVLDHPTVMTVEWVDKRTVENATNPVVVSLDRAEVEREAPALAQALTAAAERQRGQVEGSENVQQAWSHIDEKLGREYRSRLYLELESAYYAVSQDVG
jgi:hypothetical protein